MHATPAAKLNKMSFGGSSGNKPGWVEPVRLSIQAEKDRETKKDTQRERNIPL